MALADFALVTPDEAWDFLDATDDQRATLLPSMEGWINAASRMVEQECNRPIKLRDYNVTQDGNGRRTLVTEWYPISTLTSITIRDMNRINSYVIDVVNDIALDKRTGHITLLWSAPVLAWFYGRENIALHYTAGFDGDELEPFKDAVLDLIAVHWKAIGRDPLEFVRSDNIGNNISFTRMQPRQLPFSLQLLKDMYRRVEI